MKFVIFLLISCLYALSHSKSVDPIIQNLDPEEYYGFEGDCYEATISCPLGSSFDSYYLASLPICEFYNKNSICVLNGDGVSTSVSVSIRFPQYYYYKVSSLKCNQK